MSPGRWIRLAHRFRICSTWIPLTHGDRCAWTMAGRTSLLSTCDGIVLVDSERIPPRICRTCSANSDSRSPLQDISISSSCKFLGPNARTFPLIRTGSAAGIALEYDEVQPGVHSEVKPVAGIGSGSGRHSRAVAWHRNGTTHDQMRHPRGRHRALT